MLVVREMISYPRGTLEALLLKAYENFHAKYPEYADENLRKFHECDTFFYDNQTIGNSCSFITEYNNALCGMCCWDPRNYPEAIIGHNCISPEFRGKRLGIEQLAIAVTVLREREFKKLTVSTGLLDFFIPAQKMYQSVGFKETNRDDIDMAVNKLHAQIYYELAL